MTNRIHSVSNEWDALACKSRKVAHTLIYWNFYWKSVNIRRNRRFVGFVRDTLPLSCQAQLRAQR